MSHKLPNGQWRASVQLPDGRRLTRTDPLKRVVDAWADKQRTLIRTGRWRDERDAQITLREWQKKWWAARIAERTTMARNDEIWRIHVEPHWGDRRLDSIGRLEVSTWLRGAIDSGTGVETARKALSLLSLLLQAAVDDDPPLLDRNPCRGLARTLPPTVVRPAAYLTRDQVTAVLGHLDEPWRTLVDLGTCTGLRWGEIAGLRRDSFDFPRGLIHVSWVRERSGVVREYPKSKKSRRSVPIPDHCAGPLGELVREITPAAPVFVWRGRPIDHYQFTRIWHRALAAAGVPVCGVHVMRHTAASWLVMDGMDLYRVQALLGHETHVTTMRYSHLAPDFHADIREAWRRIRRTQVAHTPRTDR